MSNFDHGGVSLSSLVFYREYEVAWYRKCIKSSGPLLRLLDLLLLSRSAISSLMNSPFPLPIRLPGRQVSFILHPYPKIQTCSPPSLGKSWVSYPIESLPACLPLVPKLLFAALSPRSFSHYSLQRSCNPESFPWMNLISRWLVVESDHSHFSLDSFCQSPQQHPPPPPPLSDGDGASSTGISTPPL